MQRVADLLVEGVRWAALPIVLLALVGCSSEHKSDAEQAASSSSRLVFPDGSEARLEVHAFLPDDMRGCESLVLEPDEINLSKVEAGDTDEGGTEPTVATFYVFAYAVDCE